MTEDYPELTNKWVADRLALSESGVSRLRSGDRLPSLAVMQSIEQHFNWSVQDQSNARAAEIWTTQFNQILDTIARSQAANPNVDTETGEVLEEATGQKSTTKKFAPGVNPPRGEDFNTTVGEYDASTVQS